MNHEWSQLSEYYEDGFPWTNDAFRIFQCKNCRGITITSRHFKGEPDPQSPVCLTLIGKTYANCEAAFMANIKKVLEG